MGDDHDDDDLVVLLNAVDDSVIANPVAIIARKLASQQPDIGMPPRLDPKLLETAVEPTLQRPARAFVHLPGRINEDDLVHVSSFEQASRQG